MKESRPLGKYLKVVALVVVLVGLALKEGFNCANPSFSPVPAPTALATVTPAVALTPAPTPVPIQSTGNPIVLVWINTNSGVYHCPNTRWYGNTKSGRYMTQEEAQAKGYRPAYGARCG